MYTYIFAPVISFFLRQAKYVFKQIKLDPEPMPSKLYSSIFTHTSGN